MWTDGSVENTVNNGGSGIITQQQNNMDSEIREYVRLRNNDRLRNLSLRNVKEIRICSNAQSSIYKLQGVQSLQYNMVGDIIYGNKSIYPH